MILAVETATPRGSVALVASGNVVAESALPPGRQASETFIGAVCRLLEKAGGGLGDVARVAVSAGPGSVTGLRVGMAAAKGFCFGLGIPIVPVPTLHALALAVRLDGDAVAVCPVLDARKKEVYAALFLREGRACRRLLPDMAVSPADLPRVLSSALPGGKVMFLGDGAASFELLFREGLGDRALFPPRGEGFPSAAAVGILAAQTAVGGNGAADPRTVVPAYLRRSEAEMKRRP